MKNKLHREAPDCLDSDAVVSSKWNNFTKNGNYATTWFPIQSNQDDLGDLVFTKAICITSTRVQQHVLQTHI